MNGSEADDSSERSLRVGTGGSEGWDTLWTDKRRIELETSILMMMLRFSQAALETA